ncbi:MAG: energy transducer TonB, partial [Bacteroidales bacterium]|nr:energy transducer TonB [Bacteroidales bacterium]
LVFAAFEWKTYGTRDVPLFTIFDRTEDTELPPITVMEEKQKPRPVPRAITEIEIVPDDIDTKELDIDPEIKMDEAVIEDIPFYLPKEEPVEEPVILIPGKMPEFPGGESAMYAYIQQHLKYPAPAAQIGIQGKVFARFIVEKDGSISHIEIPKGLGFGCDEEVIRVIKSMPLWQPGKQGPHKVRVLYTLPVHFKLE